METHEKPKQPNKLTWSDYLLIAGVAMVFYFVDNSHKEILNYPEYLNWGLFITIIIGVVLWRFRKFEQKYMALQTTGDRLFHVFINLAMLGAGAWVGASLLLTPFDYYNVHVARQNPMDSLVCNIDSAVVGERNTVNGIEASTIYFHAYSKPATVQTQEYSSALTYMHMLHSYSQYRIVLGVHKGLLDTWWLDKWSLRYNPPIPTGKGNQ